ncbi:hypothetical protein SASPL_156525 [Salvia splendens]|uniref:Protein kinase domain-containing protein n=1 Tax=Salvia splendens TaxID=180675 RepID=A0A8X8YVT1_SALSN|nr:hypothetical protein SASPL_156525 [Salvia splendens]
MSGRGLPGLQTLRGSHREATSKLDVYSFGVFLLELLSGRHPSEHPNLTLDEMMSWLRSVSGEEGGENRLEVALACTTPSPEQRPMMW